MNIVDIIIIVIIINTNICVNKKEKYGLSKKTALKSTYIIQQAKGVYFWLRTQCVCLTNSIQSIHIKSI